jgi:hypothetical protein
MVMWLGSTTWIIPREALFSAARLAAVSSALVACGDPSKATTIEVNITIS